MSDTIDIIQLIQAERKRQDEKWGMHHHDSFVWVTIITEELGEVAQAVFKQDKEAVKAELVQVAAVVVAWLGQL